MQPHLPLLQNPSPCLVSCCLMGFATRYDGAAKPNAACISALTGRPWIPICPEQLGGLSTPREPARLIGGDGHAVLAGGARVISASDKDVTSEFIRGAHITLAIARRTGAAVAILKARSPSCAIHGTMGVTAALLAQHGLALIEY